MAERGGFEPPVRFAYTRFPSVLLKPLGHLSGGGESYQTGKGAEEFGSVTMRVNAALRAALPTAEGLPSVVGSKRAP